MSQSLHSLGMRCLPFLRWWPRVNRHTQRADLLAGLTGGLILVPQGVAFATIAGMPPEYGLYAAMWPAVVAALWGSSWHLVSGPTTAISIVVFATISPLAQAGSARYVELVLTLTFLMGVFQLFMGLLKLGSLVNFVSHTVVVGFTSGAAVLIAASQVKNFFGLAIAQGSSVWVVLQTLFTHVGAIQMGVTAVASATVLACVLSKRWWPKAPHLLVGMVVGSGLAAVLNAHWGAAHTGIQSMGALQVGLPPLSWPDLSLDTVLQMAPTAAVVALLAITEAASIARAIALKSGQRIDGNQEFIGQGLSNLVGSFFSGYASSGSFNRSGLNYEAGAQTPLATIYASGFLLLIMLFLAPLARDLPIAAMAGVLWVVAWGLFDWRQMRDIARASRQEAWVLAATFVATLTLALEYAIYVGVGLSIVFYLRRTSRPVLQVRGAPTPLNDAPNASLNANGQAPTFAPWPQGVAPDSIRVLKLNGSIYFGAVHAVQEALQALDDDDKPPTHVLLDASGIHFIDWAGAHLLAQEAQRRRALGVRLYLSEVNPEVWQVLEQTGALETVGQECVSAAS